MFVGDASESANTLLKWDEKSSFLCSPVENRMPLKYVLKTSQYKTISSNRRALLGASFYKGNLSNENQICVQAKVKIIEKKLNSSLDTVGRKHSSETRQIALCTSGPEHFKLQHPILIKPHRIYEISTQFQCSVSIPYYNYKNDVVLADGTIVKFYGANGPVTCSQYILD